LGEICNKFENMECEEDDDVSDDSYDGILKPAFVVEGEPDFESGPPVDGWEYLRRVRF
jgi:gem associated protein 2